MAKIGVVINSKARNAEALTSYLEVFDAHNIKYSLYQEEPEYLDQLLKITKEKHSLLLVGGGDGTIRSAAQCCAHSGTTLGVIPLGTLNHFAKELNLPSTPEQLIEAIKQNQTTTIDIAQVNDLIFINNSSIGFYPHFAKKRKYYSRFYNKWISYIPGFLEAIRYHPTFDLTIQSDAFCYTFRTSFLMVSNNIYSYEFPIKFTRDSFIQAVLGLYFFKQGTLRLTNLIRSLFNRRSGFEFKQTEESIQISIKGLKEINVSLDGEVVILPTPLHYKSLPLALTILMSTS